MKNKTKRRIPNVKHSHANIPNTFNFYITFTIPFSHHILALCKTGNTQASFSNHTRSFNVNQKVLNTLLNKLALIYLNFRVFFMQFDDLQLSSHGLLFHSCSQSQFSTCLGPTNSIFYLYRLRCIIMYSNFILVHDNSRYHAQPHSIIVYYTCQISTFQLTNISKRNKNT